MAISSQAVELSSMKVHNPSYSSSFSLFSHSFYFPLFPVQASNYSAKTGACLSECVLPENIRSILQWLCLSCIFSWPPHKMHLKLSKITFFCVKLRHENYTEHSSFLALTGSTVDLMFLQAT